MDTSPTALFNDYEKDFEQLLADVNKKLGVESERDGVGEPFSR